MKRLTLLFLSVVCSLCLVFALTACGNSEKEASQGLKYELSEDKESYIVTGIGSFDGINLVIPSKYDGKPVTAIGQAAFYDCMKLTNVTIPDSVTSIGDKAFDGCIIKKLTAPALSIPYIPNDTLETVIITSGEKIPDSAFYGCKKLTSVTLPNSLTAIGRGAFGECGGLTSVTIPKSVTSIGHGVFYKCESLTIVTFEDTSNWGIEHDYDWQEYCIWHNYEIDKKIDIELEKLIEELKSIVNKAAPTEIGGNNSITVDIYNDLFDKIEKLEADLAALRGSYDTDAKLEKINNLKENILASIQASIEATNRIAENLSNVTPNNAEKQTKIEMTDTIDKTAEEIKELNNKKLDSSDSSSDFCTPIDVTNPSKNAENLRSNGYTLTKKE